MKEHIELDFQSKEEAIEYYGPGVGSYLFDLQTDVNRLQRQEFEAKELDRKLKRALSLADCKDGN